MALDAATTAYLAGGGTLMNGSIPTIPAGSTTLAQDQAAAANQGKAGYDVFGQPVKVQPTTISGDQSQKIADNTQKTADINNGIQQNQQNNKAAVLSGGFQYWGDGVTPMNAPSDAVQQTDADGHTWWTSGGKNYAVGPDTGLSPEQQKTQDLIASLQTQSDTYFSGAIASVKAAYDSLIAQQKQINAGAEAGTSTASIASGSSRYDPTTAAGNMQAQMSYGLQKISDLTAKEMAAISDLNKAQMDKNYELADKKISEISKIRDSKQAAANKLQNDIQSTVKSIRDEAQKQQDSIDSSIRQIITESKKGGASDSQIADMSKALANHDYAGAVQAAGTSLQDPTSNAGMYSAYLATQKAKGKPAMSAGDFLAAQKYKEAYASASAQEQAKSQFTNSDSNQNKLEQQYRTALLKTISSRSGELGIQSAKVDQAIHLQSLLDQYKDKDGNYNVPKAQYAELAMGLANLVSGTNGVTEGAREAIMQKTAAGDLKGAITYITGTPQSGSTQDVINNIADSIARQGQIAESLRDQLVKQIVPPTDLSIDRQQEIYNKTIPNLPSYNKMSKGDIAYQSPEQINDTVTSGIADIIRKDPTKQAMIDEMKATGKSVVEVGQALGILPKQ